MAEQCLTRIHATPRLEISWSYYITTCPSLFMKTDRTPLVRGGTLRFLSPVKQRPTPNGVKSSQRMINSKCASYSSVCVSHEMPPPSRRHERSTTASHDIVFGCDWEKLPVAFQNRVITQEGCRGVLATLLKANALGNKFIFLADTPFSARPIQ